MTPNNSRGNLLSGVLGGLVVAVVVAVLLTTGVVDTGKTETKIISATTPIGQPSNDVESTVKLRRSSRSTKEDGPGVAFIQSQAGSTAESGAAAARRRASGFVLDKKGQHPHEQTT